MMVLRLDAAWNPHEWASHEDVAGFHAKGCVLRSLGEPCLTLRGGTNRASGRRTVLDIHPIVVTEGICPSSYERFVPPFSRRAIFRRDRGLCLYCGDPVSLSSMTLDHVRPQAQGGTRTYKNIVSSCERCNRRKRDRTPEEASMPLLCLPYEPNLAENLILSSRHKVLADQMDFLLSRVGKHSRLLQ